MTEAEFRKRRRQKFLTEKYFWLNTTSCTHEVVENTKAIDENAFGPDNSSYAGVPGSSFKNCMKLLRLHYTAGESIESLKPPYAEALRWFDDWHEAYRAYIADLAARSGDDLRTDGTPVHFEDLFHFQLVLDVVSLGILLGEGDGVRRAASWLDRYRGTDMLMEYLLETIVPDPRDIEVFFHEQPYGALVDAIYTADTPQQSVAFMQQYLDGWYKSFEGVPWHDGHLVQTDEYSNYEGYWAFEAAAVCVLHGIDDSSFRDHIVYPKDLADWARAHRAGDAVKLGVGAADSGADGLRCEAGQLCPREGWWFTPAQAGSRRRFQQGEVMPDTKSPWGTTIWQWDIRQD
jgi:hypothetical protein